MKRHYWVILLSFSVFIGCTDSGTEQPVDFGDTLQLDTLLRDTISDSIVVRDETESVFRLSSQDKAILDLLTSIDMGYSFNKVKQNYPNVKGIRPEEKKDDLANEGLTESVCNQDLFGGIAKMEFNFEHDSLYSYYFTFVEKDSEIAEIIFYTVKDYISEIKGEPVAERVEEENHYNKNYNWPSPKNASIMTFINFELNSNTIIIGKRRERSPL